MDYKNTNLLENLLGVKAKVLKLFLQHPQLILSTKDIIKRTGIKSRESGKVILFFTKFGILKKINGNGKPRSRIEDTKKPR
ncbi:MAG: hypothetical protein Q8Q90_01930 [bacterium]|nr:hypothetical protein [bacterium]